MNTKINRHLPVSRLAKDPLFSRSSFERIIFQGCNYNCFLKHAFDWRAEGQLLDINIYICNRKSQIITLSITMKRFFVCNICVKQPMRVFPQGLISGKMFYSSRELFLQHSTVYEQSIEMTAEGKHFQLKACAIKCIIIFLIGARCTLYLKCQPSCRFLSHQLSSSFKIAIESDFFFLPNLQLLISVSFCYMFPPSLVIASSGIYLVCKIPYRTFYLTELYHYERSPYSFLKQSKYKEVNILAIEIPQFRKKF